MIGEKFDREDEPLDARFRINGMLDSLAAMLSRRVWFTWALVGCAKVVARYGF